MHATFRFAGINKTNRLCDLSQSLQTTTTSLSLLVVAAFWYFIHEVNALSIHHHGISAAIITLDFIFSANGMKFVSTIAKPFSVTVLYVVFSVVLEFAANKRMYVALDWKKNPKVAIINTTICLILLTIIHGVLALIKKWMLRDYVVKTQVPETQSAKSSTDGSLKSECQN